MHALDLSQKAETIKANINKIARVPYEYSVFSSLS